jgi:hypothetical protein
MPVRSQIPSFIHANPAQRRELVELTARERQWYANHPRFQTNGDIVAAAAQKWRGPLRWIHPDNNVEPIGRLRNPELREIFPPYLLKSSAVALKAIGRAWRRELIASGINQPELRLAVTSLARSQEMQDKIVADPGKLAVSDSTHIVAAAFDIDASGYYIKDRRGLVSITHPDRSKFKEAIISGRLRGMVSHPYSSPPTSEVFNPAVIDALVNVSGRLHELGLINRVLEYTDTPNQCVHIAPNPTTIDTLRSAV